MWQFGQEKGRKFVEFAKKLETFYRLATFAPQKIVHLNSQCFFFQVLDGKHLINDKTIANRHETSHTSQKN
jgi:hypothetical protein